MREDAMPSGQNQVSTYTHHPGGQDNLYNNHNMAPTQSDHFYRTVRVPMPQSSGSAIKSNGDSGTIGNYRLSHQSRNFYSPDAEIPEPLPIPMAVHSSPGQSTDDDAHVNGCGLDCPAGQDKSPSGTDVHSGAPPPS